VSFSLRFAVTRVKVLTVLCALRMGRALQSGADGRESPTQTGAGESAHDCAITWPASTPKLDLLTMRRNGPAVPLHGTRVEVLRGELAAPWRIAFLIFRKLSNFEQSPGIPPL
jgi:hypothetical protein